MKIEDVIPNDFVKLKRKSTLNSNVPWRVGLLAKRLLIVLFGSLMCAGFYYFGHESNKHDIMK